MSNSFTAMIAVALTLLTAPAVSASDYDTSVNILEQNVTTDNTVGFVVGDDNDLAVGTARVCNTRASRIEQNVNAKNTVAFGVGDNNNVHVSSATVGRCR